MTALLFGLLTSAMFYLGSRALITSFVWSRYPAWLSTWADCAACSGFWYGTLMAATVGQLNSMSYLGLDLTKAWNWPLVGLCSIAATPMFSWLMLYGLDYIGVAAPIEPPTT